MSKILAVSGATGQQGSSVVNYILSDKEHSRQNIRGGDIAAALGKSAGEKMVYKQIGFEEWRDNWPFAKDLFEHAYRFDEEHKGYYGLDSADLIQWAATNARERPD